MKYAWPERFGLESAESLLFVGRLDMLIHGLKESNSTAKEIGYRKGLEVNLPWRVNSEVPWKRGFEIKPA
jgi:hypothetical protein